MSQMFSDCPKLKTIYVSNLWNTGKVTYHNKMFSGCTSLVGGNGTKYNSSYIDKTYARIDKKGARGYLTKAKSTTLKTGLEFNALIPETTTAVVFTDEIMPANATLIDVDADGDGGVVAWLDGTTFKISTQIQGKKIIFNEDCSYMFCGGSGIGNKTTIAQNIVSIDFTKVNTSNVKDMSCMFNDTGFNATNFNLDLSNLNTSQVTNMYSMFNNAGQRATTFSLDLSS